MTHKQRSIATVIYADVFDYPLTRDELSVWLIGGGGVRVSDLHVVRLEGVKYFVLRGRDRLPHIRRMREQYARHKWSVLARYIRWLARVPTVSLIGVTGTLAMNNTKKEDDIDLLVVTAARTLWITRLIITIIVDCFGVRRMPDDINVTDKICLNMFMDESALSVTLKHQDLFAAHEVLQMQPVFERNNVYMKFLLANKWTEHYLPNAWRKKVKSKRRTASREKTYLFSIFCFLFSIIEPAAKTVQLWYMKKRRTSEIVGDTIAQFHPVDARTWVRKKYENRLSEFDIPLDNIFYHR